MQAAMAVLVSGVVALLGVTSAVLGFIAEAKTAVAVLLSVSTTSSLQAQYDYDHQVGDGLMNLLAIASQTKPTSLVASACIRATPFARWRLVPSSCLWWP